jgi:hypothetical protein
MRSLEGLMSGVGSGLEYVIRATKAAAPVDASNVSVIAVNGNRFL